MPPQDLPSYVKWVVDQNPELHDTPDDIKAELYPELQERLESLINTALLAAMPEAELPYFERLLEHGSDEDVQQFCQQNVPNMEEIISRILLQFRNEYLGA